MEKSVIYKNGAFRITDELAHDQFCELPISEVKAMGWRHNKKDGWFTTNLSSAALLRAYCDEKAKYILNKAFIQHTPWKGALHIPKGLKLLPFQPTAVQYSLERSRSYLALSPGLGKTPIAAVIAATMGVRTIVVVPPFLQLNTLEEFQKWAPKLHTKILDNVDWVVPDVLIVPDSQITNPYVQSYIKAFKTQLFIGDEWHRYKTETAKRSKAMFGFTDRRKKIAYTPGILDGRDLQKVVVMSGTPMPNRPIELYSTFRKLAGQYIDFMSMHQFGVKYCAAFPIKNEWNGNVYGYDYTGCDEENFKKLMKRVKTPVKIHKNKTVELLSSEGFMLRLNKSILGLPKLTEEIVVLGEDMPRELKSMDYELLKHYSPKDLIKMVIKKLMGKATSEEDVHIMTYRRLLGEYKVNPACDYIEDILETTEENHLIVAIHKEVVAKIADRLSDYNPMVITGDIPVMKRQKMVKEYQTSKNRRVLIGNLDAIGVGFTITKANRVPLIEYEYDPGSNRQVIDRAHRYGVQHEVLAQYLVFRNSLDRRVIETLLEKEKLIKHV